MMTGRNALWIVAGWVALVAQATAADRPQILVGVAKVDITPDYPVRLCGYASRRTESEGVAQRLWAKAMALGGDEPDGAAMVISVETCGVPKSMVDELCRRLAPDGVRRERLVVSVTHSHTAPWLTGYAPFLLREPLPDEHRQHLQRYQRELVEHLVAVARQALKNRQPARLFWSQGKVGFAANRRVLRQKRWTGFGEQPDGPVDHRVPVLLARDLQMRPIAIWLNYACHCTTLGGNFYQICGDWAGYAAQYIESEFPDATVLISIGCGADANPKPRGKLEYCQQHGRAMADEVKRLMREDWKPVDPALRCRLVRIDLPLDRPATRNDWQAAAEAGGHSAALAKHFLQVLDRGGTVPASVSYPVATWTFGDDLAMVFLGGEVVVDYANRLRDELDGDRLWITAYANEIPCYIASKRILREGGYEADSSMVYYGQPGRLAPETEDLVIATVKKLLPAGFSAARSGASDRSGRGGR